MGEEQIKKVPKKVFFGWPTRAIATSISAVLLGYVTYFATDFMGISAATAGIIFMITKIFDGFTDIIAGYLIDRTKTKWGKGRPYELAVIGYMLSLALIFCAPEMGVPASCVYLFVMYSLVNSVFMTMLNCCDSVYLANALEDQRQSVSILAFTGFISLVFTMGGSIIMPQMIAAMGSTRAGWMKIAVMITIPCTLIGLIRFFTVKERTDITQASENKVTLREMLGLLKQNKYILIFAVIILVSNIGSNIGNGAGVYYFMYIMHDIGLQSIMALSMVAVVLTIVLTPVLSKKFGFMKVMRAATLIGAVGYLIRLIDVSNIGLLFASSALALLGFNTMFSFAGSFIINCMDYGEWKTEIRSEGTIACAQSVTAKIGAAFGAGAVGVLMGIAGYQGSIEAQAASANIMIILLNTVIPAVFCVGQYILLRKFDLEEKMPQIQEELAKRRAEKAAERKEN